MTFNKSFLLLSIIVSGYFIRLLLVFDNSSISLPYNSSDALRFFESIQSLDCSSFSKSLTAGNIFPFLFLPFKCWLPFGTSDFYTYRQLNFFLFSTPLYIILFVLVNKIRISFSLKLLLASYFAFDPILISLNIAFIRESVITLNLITSVYIFSLLLRNHYGLFVKCILYLLLFCSFLVTLKLHAILILLYLPVLYPNTQNPLHSFSRFLSSFSINRHFLYRILFGILFVVGLVLIIVSSGSGFGKLSSVAGTSNISELVFNRANRDAGTVYPPFLNNVYNPWVLPLRYIYTFTQPIPFNLSSTSLLFLPTSIVFILSLYLLFSSKSLVSKNYYYAVMLCIFIFSMAVSNIPTMARHKVKFLLFTTSSCVILSNRVKLDH